MTTSDTPEPSAQSPEEQAARLDELRRETAALESELGIPAAESSGAATQATSRGGWWRPVVVTVALVLLAIVAPLAVVATWAHDEISDTNRYVETVAPLAKNPAVQAAVSQRITDELLARLDIQAVTDEATQALAERPRTPPRVASTLQALGTPLANAIEGFIGDQVDKIVQSQAFADAWEEMNRSAHTQMVAVLTGK